MSTIRITGMYSVACDTCGYHWRSRTYSIWVRRMNGKSYSLCASCVRLGDEELLKTYREYREQLEKERREQARKGFNPLSFLKGLQR